jgi:hypothetical protein
MQPEALSRWTPAVSTRCSWLVAWASLSSSQSESDGRQVVASPREMPGLPGPVSDLPLLLPRADLLQRWLPQAGARSADPRRAGDLPGLARRP